MSEQMLELSEEGNYAHTKGKGSVGCGVAKTNPKEGDAWQV